MAHPTPPPGNGGLRTTRLYGNLTFLWIVLGTLFGVENFLQNHVPLGLQIGWIAAGLIAGLIFGDVIFQRQLNYFARNYEWPEFKPKLFVAAVFGGITIIGILFLGLFFFNLPAIAGGFLSSLHALVAGEFAAGYILFLRYEGREKVYLVQYWPYTGIFAIPHPPTDKTVNEKMS